jgi:hypothetical protein
MLFCGRLMKAGAKGQSARCEGVGSRYLQVRGLANLARGCPCVVKVVEPKAVGDWLLRPPAKQEFKPRR